MALPARWSRLLLGAGAVCLAAAVSGTNVAGPEPAVVFSSTAPEQAAASFASQVAALSEPGGYFDTDNLISNERSYLQVIDGLRRGRVSGGAYIGVGPDQNFSYIAEIRPEIAFIVDIRRDNLLLHLLFKALFELAETRAEYLSLLLGRPAPAAINGWRGAPIDRIVAHVERTPAAGAGHAALKGRIDSAIRRTGVPLTAADFATIAGFHQRFIDAGVELRFNSTGRPPQWHYPSYRDLLLETDASGQPANYLASEAAFQFLKSLHARDRIVPVVGDLSGPTALGAIGRLLSARGQTMSALYASNVEFYLFSHGTFPRFVENLRRIPRSGNSVVIRSVFGRYLSAGRPGDGSTSQLHAVNDLLDGFGSGRFRSYGQLVWREP